MRKDQVASAILVNDYSHQAGESVLDELPFGIQVRRAPSGEVLYTNDAFRRIMESEAASGEHVPQVPGANAAICDRHGKPYAEGNLPFARALARGEPVVVDDLVIHRHDGDRLWVRAFANPVRDPGGTMTHVVIAFTDITAEVRAVVERADIEKHLAVAVHHAPVLLFTIDCEGVLTAADGAIRAILERGRALMVGQSLFETYKNHPTVPGNVRRALAGETVSYTVEVQSLILDVWLGPLRDASGELVGAIGVCTDITESRRLQMRVIQDDRVRAMGTVAASVAHEINNPLTYVLASLEAAKLELGTLATKIGALRRQGGDDAMAVASLQSIDRLRDCLGPALAGTESIRQVTRELRTFTRPDDERLTPIDVAAVVSSVLKLVRKEIEAHARLVEDVRTSPPVLANEARLVQVLVNLLMNAWQALPAPDPASHVIGVRVGAQDDGHALIEIWDTGTGVPPERREQIFEPFVTTKDVGTGTGLGLFVCRNIIHSLRGRITVHDAPGGGALFRVTLPATRSITDSAAAAAANTAERSVEGRRLRILIIDDDPLVAGALASPSARNLFDIHTVLSGREGLDVFLADDRIDLVYCDIMMKDMSGIDFHEALERQSPQRLSKVVFMTGGAFTRRAQAFVERHGDAHVQKPFDLVTDAQRRVG